MPESPQHADDEAPAGGPVLGIATETSSDGADVLRVFRVQAEESSDTAAANDNILEFHVHEHEGRAQCPM